MNREEAIKYMGKPVICELALWGTYIGELIELSPKKERMPWRGKVRILAVQRYPVKGQDQYRRFVDRHPFEFGLVEEFGATNIRKYDEDTVPSYWDSLYSAIEEALKSLEYAKYIWAPHSGPNTPIIFNHSYYKLLEDKKSLQNKIENLKEV